MRFVYVNPRYHPFIGGSERFAQEVAESLASDGHDAFVVTTNAFDLDYFWDAGRRRVDAPRRDIINGVSVERVAVRHLPASSFAFRGLRRAMGEFSRFPAPVLPFAVASRFQPWLPDLRQALRSGGPFDLIHGSNLGLEGPALAACDIAREQRAAFVLTPFIHLGVEGDRTARRYVTMPHQRRLLRAADAVLVQTRTEAEFVASVGVEESKVVIVGSGIDPEEVTGGDGAAFRERNGIRGRLVGYLGAMAEEKGARDVVLAVGALRRAGHDVELALAGPALASFERWYDSLDGSLKHGIHWLGVIDSQDKRDFLAAIDVFALPSRTESFGIVYLEAWANRKPVIAADAGAVRDLVRDGVNGFRVPFGDPQALGDTILKLSGDPLLCGELAANGHAMVMRDYTWSHVLARVRQAYAIALGHPVPGSES